VPAASLESLHLDLGSLSSVREAAAELLRRHGSLDVLILNAGVMACPFELSADGFELQFATNHLGHFLLTYLLSDALTKVAPARVVVVSSVASFLPEMLPEANVTLRADVDNCSAAAYGPLTAYGRSKLAFLLFAHELAARFGVSSELYVNAVHPGCVWTNVARRARLRVEVGAADMPRLDLGRRGRVELRDRTLLGAPQQCLLDQPHKRAAHRSDGPCVMQQVAPPVLATEANRRALWTLSMELTAPHRAGFTPRDVIW
jgi:NAD(P)-dependent dehydrogenase (short-subunit alcohol dehydrogenase family)